MKNEPALFPGMQVICILNYHMLLSLESEILT